MKLTITLIDSINLNLEKIKPDDKKNNESKIEINDQSVEHKTKYFTLIFK